MGKTLDDPAILDLTDEDAELTYAFYTELEEQRWSRAGRMLGTTWRYEDVMRVPTAPDVDDEGNPKPPPPVSPESVVFLPLSSIMNPDVIKNVQMRFGLDGKPRNVFGDEGVDSGTENLFYLSVKDYLKKMGQDVGENNEYDLTSAPRVIKKGR